VLARHAIEERFDRRRGVRADLAALLRSGPTWTVN